MPGYRKHSGGKPEPGAVQRTLSSCPCPWRVCGRSDDVEPPPPDGLHRIMMVGLGNYQIQSSRCSVGMVAVNILAKKHNVDATWHFDRRCNAKIAVAVHGHHEIILLKPQQFMKMNGVSVRRAAEVYQIAPVDIFMIHDQIYLPLGKYVPGKKETIRNHNGVNSCINEMKSNLMASVMIGIGPPPHTTKRGRLHHKLGRFSEDQQRKLMQVLEQCTNNLLEDLDKCEKPEVQVGSLGSYTDE
ncbi:probable peptidyl-tRNA hydrolase isoform X2 [Scyliorhinus canicula]|uniref:probable peptidyl-tRNA hydrolase isoform X2 n=1 Tax=Scyliorhinus canicula TaxID=7830 RepID=UPI0018F6C4ED|nr:probable peptidyl-tRNA hydrolase isoform X2 [Scyliorhinus canicula]